MLSQNGMIQTYNFKRNIAMYLILFFRLKQFILIEKEGVLLFDVLFLSAVFVKIYCTDKEQLNILTFRVHEINVLRC